MPAAGHDSAPVLGAFIAGFAAHVLEQVVAQSTLLRDLERWMRREDAAALAAAVVDLRAAAEHFRAQTASARGSASTLAAPTLTGSEVMNTSQIADRLNVSSRRARQLAVGWASDGLAERDGREWRVPRIIVEAHARKASR